MQPFRLGLQQFIHVQYKLSHEILGSKFKIINAVYAYILTEQRINTTKIRFHLKGTKG